MHVGGCVKYKAFHDIEKQAHSEYLRLKWVNNAIDSRTGDRFRHLSSIVGNYNTVGYQIKIGILPEV